MFGYPLYYGVVDELAAFHGGVVPDRCRAVGRLDQTSTCSAIRSSSRRSARPPSSRSLHRRPDDHRHAAGAVLPAAFPFSSAMRALLLAPWLLPLVVSRRRSGSGCSRRTRHPQLRTACSAGIVSEPIPWLIERDLCGHGAVILTNIWIGIPFSMAVFHSGFQAYRAEISRRRNRRRRAWQRFWFVTLPLLKPTPRAIVFVLSVTYTVKVFDLIFVMTGGAGLWHGDAGDPILPAVLPRSRLWARGCRRQRAHLDLAVLCLLLHPILQAQPGSGGGLMRNKHTSNLLRIGCGVLIVCVMLFLSLLDGERILAGAMGVTRSSRNGSPFRP